MTSDILKAVTTQVRVFLHVTPCSVVIFADVAEEPGLFIVEHIIVCSSVVEGPAADVADAP